MLTPNDWNIMDGGSYNGDGHCPPNYDPWEKYFFGWQTPENLGNTGKKLDIIANGQTGGKAYQINSRGTQQTPTETGIVYYIENRQAKGWDAPLTGHGLLIWKVNFNSSAWTNNAPNNSSTSGAPLYTVVSATGTKIGWDGSTDNCPKNTFPGSGKKTSWTGISGKPLLNITESNGVISLVYIEEPVEQNYTVTWVVNGQTLETKTYNINGTENLVLPTKTVTPCEGTKFIGWTTEPEWFDPFNSPADLFTTASGKVTADVTYYAVFE